MLCLCLAVTGGHCPEFYSVAEHSVYVSYYVPKEHALQALLHDASEAYISDIVKPAKPYIEGYKEVEDSIMRAIYTKFGLPIEEHPLVKHADTAILVDELSQIFEDPPPGMSWDLDIKRLGVDIQCLPPAQAKIMFLDRFDELMNESK